MAVDTSAGLLGSLAGIGAAIGLGQLLLSDEPITLRRAAGRAVVTAGLSVGAVCVLSYWPALPTTVVIGFGAAVASMGTSGLEKLLSKMPFTKS